VLVLLALMLIVLVLIVLMLIVLVLVVLVRAVCRWKEHLEDKAALVQAACGPLTEEEQEESLLQPPVAGVPSDPVNLFGSRH